MERSCHENSKLCCGNVLKRINGPFFATTIRKMPWKEKNLIRIEKTCHVTKILGREKDFYSMND